MSLCKERQVVSNVINGNVLLQAYDLKMKSVSKSYHLFQPDNRLHCSDSKL